MTTWRMEPADYEDSSDVVAARIIRRLSAADRAAALLKLMVDWVAGEQRAEVRRVERRSWYSSEEARRTREFWKSADRQRVEDPEAWELRFTFKGVQKAMDELRAEVRLEITEELLAASFALGDGRVVTWGSATVSDHRERIGLLRDNILGNARTLLLHEEAIDAIGAAGVASLSAVPLAVAA